MICMQVRIMNTKKETIHFFPSVIKLELGSIKRNGRYVNHYIVTDDSCKTFTFPESSHKILWCVPVGWSTE